MDRAFFMAISTSDVSLGAAGKLLLNRSDSLPASQRIYDDLRSRIVSLELPPGTTRSRGALAKHYDVSLTPIREAMQRLEQDGLMRTFPQSKTARTSVVSGPRVSVSVHLGGHLPTRKQQSQLNTPKNNNRT